MQRTQQVANNTNRNLTNTTNITFSPCNSGAQGQM